MTINTGQLVRGAMIATFLSVAAAANPVWAAIDEVATQAIIDATTDEQYLTEWVNSLPEHPTVPSPRDVLGYTIGTPGKLTHVDDIHRYFYALAEASPNVSVVSIGKSFEGRDMLLVAVASETALSRLDDYKSITQQLSDPRKTSAADAKSLITQGKPVYWITAGLHSPELGPPEMVMELAYRLAVDEREVFKNIREEVITLITPVLETDGRARQVEWYYRHIDVFDRYDDTPPKSPPFWGHYTFHDNNRDGLTFSQPLTQNFVNVFYEWKPTLSLDLHESVPLLYVATGTGPYNEAVDPITITEWQSIANYEVSRLTGKGLPGVWTWGFYTGWFPGYLLWVTNNHNSNGRFYETFGNHTAQTVERDITNRKLANKNITEKTWYRSLPPKRKFMWSMRNNTNFMQSGVIASLEMVSRNPKMFLENFYQKGVNALERGTQKPPYAFTIAAEQRDINAANDLVNVLRNHGIELHVAQEDFGDDLILRGDVLIKLNQPYGPLARNLLEKQNFPDEVEVAPYDDVAWTLGLQMGVTVKPVEDEAVLALAAGSLGENPFVAEALSGSGQYVLVEHHAQNELGPFRFALGEATVFALDGEWQRRGKTYPAGSLIVDTQTIDRDKLTAALQRFSLTGTSLRSVPDDVVRHDIDLPRIALLQSWTSTQNAGWVRFTLDESAVPYTLISKDRVRKGELRKDFDVIVMPALWGSTTAADIIAGIDPKWSPLAYTTTDQYPSHGKILSSPDITGGLGFAGMSEVQAFIEQGGTFVGLHSGGVLVTESGITRTIDLSRPGDLNTPGSILTTKTLGSSPLTFGYDEYTHVFRGNGPLYQVADRDRDHVLMQFGDKTVPEPFEEDGEDEPEADSDEPKVPDLVLSGAILGGKEIMDGAPALLMEKVGEGTVVLFAWNPLHRHINHHDHAFFYNSLLFWNDL